MSASHWLILIHPALTIILVFPLIGIVSHRAWQTRQRRLTLAEGEKSKIPPVVGREHVEIGKWLAAGVMAITLVGLAYPVIIDGIIKGKWWETDLFRTVFLLLIFIATIVSFYFLYQARQKLWRGIFSTLSGMGLVIIGFQPEVFRRDNMWYISHFYYGILVTFLMILSLAIVEEIYKDRSQKWRYVHAILNTLALILFIGQGITGSRDLFEIAFFIGKTP